MVCDGRTKGGAEKAMTLALRCRSVAVLVILCVAAASCGSSTHSTTFPNFPTDNGTIVIDFNNGGQNDSYTAITPTSASTRKLNIPGYLRAGFNRTLTKVAIVRGGEMNGNMDTPSTLSVSSLGSSSSRAIWSFVDSVGSPISWNPSGSEVAVGLDASVDRAGGVHSNPPSGLWTVATDGSNHRQLFNGGDVGPVAWSPDGKTIAFMPATYNKVSTLEVVSAGGGPPRTIGSLDASLGFDEPTMSWSPDSRYIAVAYTKYQYSYPRATSQIVLYPASGGNPRTILGPSTDVIYRGASFSPDGTRLAVTLTDNNQTQNPPNTGHTSQTTLASAPPQQTTSPDALVIVGVGGANVHTVARFDATTLMIGWYVNH